MAELLPVTDDHILLGGVLLKDGFEQVGDIAPNFHCRKTNPHVSSDAVYGEYFRSLFGATPLVSKCRRHHMTFDRCDHVT